MTDWTEINMKGARLCGHEIIKAESIFHNTTPPFTDEQVFVYHRTPEGDYSIDEKCVRFGGRKFDIRTSAEDREAVESYLKKRGWWFYYAGTNFMAHCGDVVRRGETEAELLAACLEVVEV